MPHADRTEDARALSSAIDTLWRDGFVVFPGRVAADVVDRAREEAAQWFREDLDERRAHEIEGEWHEGERGLTRWDRNRSRHVLLRVHERSAAAALVLDRVLSDPVISRVLHRALGPRPVLGDFMIRRPVAGMARASHYEMHRDTTPYEVSIGVTLVDLPQTHSGATCCVPGSHRFPVAPPRTGNEADLDALFLPDGPDGAPCSFRDACARAREILGPRGTVYLFLCETWHGVLSMGALTEALTDAMVMLAGLFPAPRLFPPDPVRRLVRPAPSVLEALPPAVRAAFTSEGVPDTAGTLMHELYTSRASPPQR